MTLVDLLMSPTVYTLAGCITVICLYKAFKSFMKKEEYAGSGGPRAIHGNLQMVITTGSKPTECHWRDAMTERECLTALPMMHDATKILDHVCIDIAKKYNACIPAYMSSEVSGWIMRQRLIMKFDITKLARAEGAQVVIVVTQSMDMHESREAWSIMNIWVRHRNKNVVRDIITDVTDAIQKEFGIEEPIPQYPDGYLWGHVRYKSSVAVKDNSQLVHEKCLAVSITERKHEIAWKNEIETIEKMTVDRTNGYHFNNVLKDYFPDVRDNFIGRVRMDEIVH